MGTWSPYITLTCLCLISACQSSSSTLRKYAGDDAVLQCGSNNTFPIWYGPDSTELPFLRYNGTEYTGKKRRLSYCGNKRDLCLASLWTSDAGVYKCQAENHSNHITLNVQKREMFTNLSKLAGTDVHLKCDLNVNLPYWFGLEFPQIPLVYASTTVFNPNTKLVKENRLSFCENQRDLCFKDLKSYDEGEYKCIWLGIGTHKTALSVHKRNTTSEQTQKVGDKAILKCDLKGTYPTWYGSEYPSLPLIQHKSTEHDANLNPIKEGRWSYDENKRDLYIESLKKTDFGEYKCVMPGLGNHTINLRQESENETSIWALSMCVLALAVALLLTLIFFWKRHDNKNIKYPWHKTAEKIELSAVENAQIIPPADKQERQRGGNVTQDKTLRNLIASDQKSCDTGYMSQPTEHPIILEGVCDCEHEYSD